MDEKDKALAALTCALEATLLIIDRTEHLPERVKMRNVWMDTTLLVEMATMDWQMYGRKLTIKETGNDRARARQEGT